MPRSTLPIYLPSTPTRDASAGSRATHSQPEQPSSHESVEASKNAYKLFRGSHCGSGTVETEQKLRAIIRQLEDVSRQARLQGEALMKESEIEAAVEPAMGSAGAMELKIAEIKQGIASLNLTSGVAAQLAIGTIRIMLELLKSNQMPW
jgi:hypothetical protein